MCSAKNSVLLIEVCRLISILIIEHTCCICNKSPGSLAAGGCSNNQGQLHGKLFLFSSLRTQRSVAILTKSNHRSQQRCADLLYSNPFIAVSSALGSSGEQYIRCSGHAGRQLQEQEFWHKGYSQILQIESLQFFGKVFVGRGKNVLQL